MSKNEAAIDLFISNKDKIDWNTFVYNKSAPNDLLLENIAKFHFVLNDTIKDNYKLDDFIFEEVVSETDNINL